MEWWERCPPARPEQLPALPVGWESGEAGPSSWSMWLGLREGLLPAPLGQEVVEGMVGLQRVVKGKVGMEEMLREMEEVGEEEGLEESEVVRAALPLPFPQLTSSLPQLKLSLLFLPLLPYLSPPLPPPPTSAPCSSKGPLPVQMQLFLGEHPASFPRVDPDPDLIQVPRTIVPSSLLWPLKQTRSRGGVHLGPGPCLHGLLAQTALHTWGSQVLGQAPPCTSSSQCDVLLGPWEVGAQIWGLSQLLLPPLLLVVSSCTGLLAVLEAALETDGGWRAHMPGSGGLGVPGPAGEVRSVLAPSVLYPPHPVSGQESLGE